MALYLVQHGKSLPSDVDPQQGLSDEGIADTEKMARLSGELGLKPGRILHSGKTRARRTAEILGYALQPAEGVREAPGLNPLDDVLPWAVVTPEAELMLVGHLPFMERLASLLVCGSEEKPVMRFQNSGIACIDRDPAADHWVIRWAIVPKIR